MLDRQSIYIDYLFERLDFVDDTFKIQYFNELIYSCEKFYRFGAISRQEFNNRYENLFEKEPYRAEYFKNNYFYDHNDDLYIPDKYNFGIIDYLQLEISIKTKRNVHLKPLTTPFISATDIASYTYCPASFAISKSFILPKTSSAITGTALHEKTFLLKMLTDARYDEAQFLDKNWADYTDDIDILLNDTNSDHFKIIEASKLIFCGHKKKNNSNKVFKGGKNSTFIGQPDYLFLSDTNEYFVVEEKFIGNNGENAVFYENHINQVASYMYGINDYPISFGFLIYWYYDTFRKDEKAYIRRIAIKKIEKTLTLKNRITCIFSSIASLKKNKTIDFDLDSRNAKRCANCVYSLYCGHKTGNFEKISLPYSVGFMRTKNVEFPNDLKNEKDQRTNK